MSTPRPAPGDAWKHPKRTQAEALSAVTGARRGEVTLLLGKVTFPGNQNMSLFTEAHESYFTPWLDPRLNPNPLL